MEYPFTNQLLYIKRSVINVLLRNANCEPFKVPVNAELLGVPQYPKLIKCPMDFGTIKMKLDKRAYQTANECKSDFQDIFRNCYIFNEPGSLYVEMALKLENLFKRKMAELPMPEHYVPESALQTPKLNKVKKSKLSLNINTPTMPKHKPPLVTPLANVMKTEAILSRKRSRSNSGNGFKDEPANKKVKGAIDLKICKNIIQSLMSKNYHDWNRYFLEPVDVEGLKLHDYYTIVKKPIDLSTVKAKLLEGRYQTNVEFSEDIKLIFKNCYLYNPEGHEVRRCGQLLEGIFMKLYQSAFPQNKPHLSKPVRTQPNYTEFQPLLQKILKRQTEIDVLNSDISKQNQEIQNSLEYIRNTEFIKSFNVHFNGNHKMPISVPKKPPSKSVDPIKLESKPPLSHITTDNTKAHSPRAPVVPKFSTRDIKSDISLSNSHTDDSDGQYKLTELPEAIPQRLPKQETTYDNSLSNHRSSGKPPKDIEHGKKLQINEENLPPNNSAYFQHSPIEVAKPIKSIVPKELDSVEAAKIAKNNEEFNSNLKEIKEWIGCQSESDRDSIRDFINKSECRNVVQVNLLKLKPATITGLFAMMTEMKRNNTTPVLATVDEPAVVPLRDFTNEDRMQLSHDLGFLGEKYSDKILSIYKKTESVESHDGECEIDFQKMKLVTLHRLREFADKYLQKRRAKKGADAMHPVTQNGDDSDSDSSDSSDSDSNSDASSNSSSDDADVFDNLPPPSSSTTAVMAPVTQTSHIVTENIGKNPLLVQTQSKDYASPTVQPLPQQSQQIPQPLSLSAQNQSTQPPQSSSQKTLPSTNSPLQTRLSDSSDSDDLDDEEPRHGGSADNNNGVDSSSKRLRHMAPWNTRHPTDVRSPASFAPHHKPKQPQIAHPMYSNNARNQLDESLRQIVQDAQAHENVKKQEEELRLIRVREEEEQKKQHLLKIQAMNESRKKLHTTEQMKKDQEMSRLRERALADQKQRNLDIPQAIEREDYHQLLCDFEYNINHSLIAKLVHAEQHQVHP